MLVLGLESSCDEMAAAIVENGRKTISQVIDSQADIHSRFGGVVPELASRKHVEALIPVISACLEQAGVTAADIDAIGVTQGPGLVGALLVALTAAKALSAVWKKPLYPVHHIAGHIAANYLSSPELEPPFLCLIVSGGHSHLVEVTAYMRFRILGRTRDDAAGEAFDKVARVLGLGYPGGPAIERAAQGKNEQAFTFPKPQTASLDFSFSGLKTFAMTKIQQAAQQAKRMALQPDELFSVGDFAASFQRAITDILVEHTMEAAAQTDIKRIALAGGVAANKKLRESFQTACRLRGLDFYCPPLVLCTDNAEMIAAAAYFQKMAGAPAADAKLNAKPSWSIEELLTESRK